MNKRASIFLLVVILSTFLFITSCSTPVNYLSYPSFVHYYQSKSYVAVKNVDGKGSVYNDNQGGADVKYHDSFVIRYELSDINSLSITIINSGSSNLVIDKSQCFSVRKGKSNPLFGGVSTTNTVVADRSGEILSASTTANSIIIPPGAQQKFNSVSGLEPSASRTVGTVYYNETTTPDWTEIIIDYRFQNDTFNRKISRNKLYFNKMVTTKGEERFNQYETYSTIPDYSGKSYDAEDIEEIKYVNNYNHNAALQNATNDYNMDMWMYILGGLLALLLVAAFS